MPPEPLKVTFLVEELGRSGGMAVVRRHARHLLEQGARCELVVCAAQPGTLPAEDDGVPVRALAAARDEPVDVAVATWWTTTEALFEVPAGRRVLFMQNLEHRFYAEEELAERLGALSVLDLPVDFVVVASHMERLLAELRPDARVARVVNGIDKAVFRARPPAGPREGPLRVLVEGQPTLWFKAVPEAVAAVRGMTRPATVTVAVHDPAAAGGLEADRVVGGLDAPAMAELYAEHDVLLKLSRFEGFGLPPLEAFHVGVPCVVTPFTGSEDYVEHGANGLVVGFDDEPGTSGALDLLAGDRDLLERLGRGALATAAGWPDHAAASGAFADALRRIADEPPPPVDGALRRAARTRRLTVELVREQQRQAAVRLHHTRGEVRWYADAYEQAKGTIGELHGIIETLRGRKALRIADALNARLRRAR